MLYFLAVKLAFVALVRVPGARDQMVSRQQTHFSAAEFACAEFTHSFQTGYGFLTNSAQTGEPTESCRPVGLSLPLFGSNAKSTTESEF